MSWSTISWMVSWLPDSLLMLIFYGCFFAGVALILASWFVSFIPLLNRYRFPTQVVGILAYGAGAFLIGGLGTELGWRERVAELEKKVQEAEAKSAQVNTVIQEKIVYKTKVIKQKEIEYIDRIKEVEKVIDAKCEVDSAAIDILNKAATDPNKEEAK
jgi:hypothetical protein